MSAFAQSFDPNERVYVKIHVASGDVVGRQVQPYPGIDEIEPLEHERPVRQGIADPLEAYR